MRSGIYLDRGTYAVEIVLPASFQGRGKLYLEPAVRVAAVVPQHQGTAGGKHCEIQVAVVVQVADLQIFDGRRQAGQQVGPFLECTVAQVPDQPESRQAWNRSTGKREINESVIVEIEGPDGGDIEAVTRVAERRGRVLPVESASIIVPQQSAALGGGPRHEKVQCAVVVEVGRGDRLRSAPPDSAESFRPVHPPALPQIPVEPVRAIVEQRDHVDGAVQVEVAPGQRLARGYTIDITTRFEETRRGGGLFKKTSLRMSIEPKRARIGLQDIQVPVVVEIRPGDGGESQRGHRSEGLRVTVFSIPFVTVHLWRPRTRLK